jgi:hypothetical protein
LPAHLKSPRPDPSQTFLCECGCGQVVKWTKGRPNRFVLGHAVKGQRFSEEHRQKIAAALKQYANSPTSHQHVRPITGPEHGCWKTGINNKTRRRIAFQAWGMTCQQCGSTENVQVHHKDYNQRNNDPANLAVLCRTCHARIHGKDRIGRKHSEETKAKLRALALLRPHRKMSAETIAKMILAAQKRERGLNGRFTKQV